MNDRTPPLPALNEQPTLVPVASPSETATIPPASPDSAAILTGPSATSAHGDALAPAGYVIEKELGRGGMGVVYLARSLTLDRPCALKMILSGAHSGEGEQDRFRTEAQAIARLQHPGIVQVFEIGQHSGLPFMALEFCGGGSLDRTLAKNPLKPKEAAKLVRSLAESMQAAHEAKVIHRDLKPANVLLTEKGESKITDFGLAKKLDEDGATRTGSVMGTPSYMPPEQAEGKKDIGPAADIYALGAILYQCLASRPPFKAPTALDTILQVLTEEPVPVRQLNPQAPVDLETIAHKCLQKDPTKRYPAARDLADDLERYLKGEPIKARPVGAAERAAKWVRRNKVVAALSGALAMAVIAALIGWGVYTAALDREKRRADKKADEALANYRLAEKRFLLAMGVVDRYFTEVSQGTLLHEAGMEPLRKSLLRNARDFYSDFVKGRDGDERLARELARSQYRLGLIEAELGDPVGAIRLFDDALTRLDAIEKDESALEDRALILHHRGRVLRQSLLRVGEAEKSYSSALEIWTELKGRKDEPRFRAGEATTLLGLGNVATDRRDYALAQKRYSDVVELRKTLVASDPKNESYQRDLATAYQNLAVALERNDAKSARAARAEALNMQQGLVKQFPSRAKYREDLGMSWYNRGEDELRSNRAADAVASYQHAVQLFSALALAHPEVPGYRGRLADAYGNQAFAYERTNLSADAHRVRRLAIEVSRDLARDFPDAEEHELGLIRGLLQAGERSLALEDATESRRYLTEARKRLETLAKKPGGDHRLLQAEVLHEVGRVELREDRYAAAKEAFESALAGLEKDRPPGSFSVEASCYNNLALIARLQGEPEKALPLYVRVDSAAQPMRKDSRLTALAAHYTEESLRGRAQALDESGQREAALVQWGELLKRQSGPAKTLTEARRLVTLAGTNKVDEAVTQGEKMASGATAAVRYELARAYARAAVSANSDGGLAKDEREKRVQSRRAAAMGLLAGLHKEGAFKPNTARRRLLADLAFVELRTSDEFKALVPPKR